MGLENNTVSIPETTHGEIIDFGKYKGTRWTRVPVGYLSWLANQKSDSPAIEIARMELKRRGSTYPRIKVSGHAMDRASLYCLKIWQSSRKENEGLHAWLMRVAVEAREKGIRNGEKIHYHGMKFVFEEGEFYPSLKTVIH